MMAHVLMVVSSCTVPMCSINHCSSGSSVTWERQVGRLSGLQAQPLAAAAKRYSNEL
jgi:hypothetical protein